VRKSGVPYAAVVTKPDPRLGAEFIIDAWNTLEKEGIRHFRTVIREYRAWPNSLKNGVPITLWNERYAPSSAKTSRACTPSCCSTSAAAPQQESRHDRRTAAQHGGIPPTAARHGSRRRRRRLSDREQADLATCEAALDNLRLAFWAAGKALQVIRDARLYRDTHATFEDYVEQRWDMSRSQAYRLVDAWPLAERLSPMGDKLNERQIRELLPLASRHGQDAAVTVYRTVAETEGIQVTAALLASSRPATSTRPRLSGRSAPTSPETPATSPGRPPTRSRRSRQRPRNSCGSCTGFLPGGTPGRAGRRP
jgi:hypothetical protein